jgi:hypothetical protein
MLGKKNVTNKEVNKLQSKQKDKRRQRKKRWVDVCTVVGNVASRLLSGQC